MPWVLSIRCSVGIHTPASCLGGVRLSSSVIRVCGQCCWSSYMLACPRYPLTRHTHPLVQTHCCWPGLPGQSRPTTGGATDVRAPPAAASLLCGKEAPCTLQIARPAKPTSSGFIARSTRPPHVFVSQPSPSSPRHRQQLLHTHCSDTSSLDISPRSHAQLTGFAS